MEWALIFLLIALCLFLIGQGLSRPGRFYEFPFFAGTTFLGFVVPQLPAIANDRFLPAGGVLKAEVFTVLCAAMCAFGWRAGRRSPGRAICWTLDERRMLIAAAILSAVGAYFHMMFRNLPDEIRLISQASGAPVMYLFFAKAMTYGFAMAVVAFVRRPSLPALSLILFDASFLVVRVLVTGKRGEFTEFALILLLSAWFLRGIAVPRGLVVVGILAASVGLNSAEDYRSITREQGGPKIDQVANIDIVGNFRTVLERGGPEMRNAVLRIHAVDSMQTFDFGLEHWNVVVYNFVPAQLVGTALKSSLKIPFQQTERDYVPMLGSTETGMADAFASFSYLGCIKFFLVAYVLGRLYQAACEGWVVSQLVYMLSLTPGMLVITHETQAFVTGLIFMAMFMLPALLFARVRPQTAQARAA